MNKNDEAKGNILSKASQMSSIVKGCIAGGALFATLITAYNMVGANTSDIQQLERYSAAHYQNINTLEAKYGRMEDKITVLERKSDKAETRVDRLDDTLNKLNVTLAEISTTLKTMNKGS